MHHEISKLVESQWNQWVSSECDRKCANRGTKGVCALSVSCGCVHDAFRGREGRAWGESPPPIFEGRLSDFCSKTFQGWQETEPEEE